MPAHRLGLAVTGHAWGAHGIADAVAAGFDGIEHGGFFTPDGVSADPAVIEAMATNQAFVSSTGATTGPLAESVYDAEILAPVREEGRAWWISRMPRPRFLPTSASR